MSWHLGTLCALDIESTGVNTETDRVVSASVIRVDGSGQSDPNAANWLINPGVDIPESATKIHGITTGHARTRGEQPAEAIPQIVAMLVRALHAGIPVVGFNVSFDLTVLDRECRRLHLPTLAELVGEVAPVIDARILDKAVSNRSGGRKLTDCCKHWNVALDDPHQASADAWAAAGVAVRIAQRNPGIAQLTLPDLHARQIDWKREQDIADVADLRRRAADAAHVDDQLELHERARLVEATSGQWPVLPFDPQEVLT